MSDYVELQQLRNRGWPWHKSSGGLTPMFGEDGWCHSCGVPKGPQSGSLVLQRRGLRVEGAWVPNWQFDVICMTAELGRVAAERFRLETRVVRWPAGPVGDVVQIVIPTVGESWFDPEELRAEAIRRHGVAGARCEECGVWRWMPLGLSMLPPLRTPRSVSADVDIAASPEWFGDGFNAFRQVIMKRELAEFLVEASPRDFEINPNVEIIPT